VLLSLPPTLLVVVVVVVVAAAAAASVVVVVVALPKLFKCTSAVSWHSIMFRFLVPLSACRLAVDSCFPLAFLGWATT
jgi:hypothetical protein